MKRRRNLLPAALLLFWGTAAVANSDSEPTAIGEEASAVEEVVYLFVGGELSVEQGRNRYPVSTMTKKHFLVDRGGRLKRVGRQSNVIVRLQPTYSRAFIDIEAFDYAFSSTLPSLIEAQAMSDINRYQTGTEVELATVSKILQGRRYRINYEDIEELHRESESFRELHSDLSDSETFYAEQRMDRIHLDLRIVPKNDFEDVYAAVAVSYDAPRRKKSDEEVTRRSRLGAKYIGTLRANEPNDLQFQVSVDPFIPINPECELFFYHGKGNEIATSESRRIRLMPESALQKLLEEDP